MANWAIVIGIDQYLTPEVCLKGAVRDAMRMCEWLLKVDGGAVPPRNLTLLLSPQSGIHNSPGLEVLPATRGVAVQAVEQLLRRSGGTGERFFFYFSGHGATSRMDYSNESGVLFSDFTTLETTNSLTLRSICELFQSTQFREQFFIIDACRNIPWEDEYRLGEYPKPRNATLPVPPQFVMYATSPGLKAALLQQVGNAGSVFTDALLEALGGAGDAKVWDDQAQQYILRWSNVFKYVESTVKSRKLPAGDELVQEPRQAGEHGSENPDLGHFSEADFDKATLDVNLAPVGVAPQVEIVIGDLSGEVARQQSITKLPVQFTLKPRTYSVRAGVQRYRSERPYYPVDVYGPTTLSVEFLLGERATPSLTPVAELAKGLERDRTPGNITVEARDELVKVELLDASGRVVAAGEGTVQGLKLAPGFYRARLSTPEGNQVEELIELQPGDPQHRVLLRAPAPPDSTLFRAMTDKAGIRVESSNRIDPSEAVGQVATAQVSTLLALAGGAANEEGQDAGRKLRQIGVSSFQALTGQLAKNGVEILFGIEGDSPTDVNAYISSIKLRCWPLQGEMPNSDDRPSMLPSTVGLAQFAWSTQSGQHWLSIQSPDQRPVTLAVTVLPHHLALIVFHRGVAGGVNIYQYLPSLRPGDSSDASALPQRFSVLRRSELIQRSYLSGRLEEPGQNAVELLYAKWVEPIAGCLGGYILLKVNPDHRLLPVATENMVRNYGELSDSHVVRAVYLAHRGDDEHAQASFQTALDRGLPVMSDGLSLLVDGIQRYNIQHTRVGFIQDVFRNRVRGLLWTAVPVAEDTRQIFNNPGVVTSNQSGGINQGTGSRIQAENAVGRDQHIDNHEETYTAARDINVAKGNAQMIINQTTTEADAPLQCFSELARDVDTLHLPASESGRVRSYVELARMEAKQQHKDDAADNLKHAARILQSTAPSAMESSGLGESFRRCLRWAGKDENWLTQ